MILTTKEATTLPITNSVAPIKNQKGLITGAVLIFRDDSQRRLQEERLLQSEQTQMLQRRKEELQRLNLVKDDFLSVVFQELRSPLANIKMTIRMMELTIGQKGGMNPEGHGNSDHLTHYLNILRDQCNQELSLVNDLLELQQLEAGVLKLKWVSIHLYEWVSQGMAIFRDLAYCANQHLQMLVSPDLPVLVSDRGILTRIFTELLMNACTHTPPGGDITVTVCPQPENRIQLIVCNTGASIPAEDLTHIFDQFYQTPTGNHCQQRGTGLGLALVKKSVTHLGGLIWAENRAGQIRFIVELPLSPSDPPASSMNLK
ncbi:MAG: HAMP domain-containing sensor histidine kinase [Kovacikia sp.]